MYWCFDDTLWVCWDCGSAHHGCIGLASARHTGLCMDLFRVGPAERSPDKGETKIRLDSEWLILLLAYSAFSIQMISYDQWASMTNVTQLKWKWLCMTQWVFYWVNTESWGCSLSKSGHGMVHLLLIVNPSPSLQFLRDPGLVSHTLSPCCLNNKPLTPRLELRYMTFLTARWALYLKINKCLKQQICLVICQNVDTWHYGILRENFKTSKQRH